VLCQFFCRILLGHFHQFGLFTPPGNPEIDPGASLLLQPGIDNPSLGQFQGKQDILRDVLHLDIILLYKRGQNFIVIYFGGFINDKVFPAHQLAASDEEHYYTGKLTLPGQGNDILICEVSRNYFLFFNNFFDIPDPVPEFCRLFKIQVFRSFLHPDRQGFNQFLMPALKKQADISYHFQILFPVHFTLAGGQAAPDMVIKAGTFLPVHRFLAALP